MSDIVKEILNLDPIDMIEKSSGKRIETMTDNEKLASIAAFIGINNVKKEALMANNDTYYSISWSDFQMILAKNGFDPVYNKPIPGTNDVEGIWLKDGFMIHAESYWNHKSINSGNLYAEIDCNSMTENQFDQLCEDLNGTSYSWILKDEHTILNGMENVSGVFISYDIREGMVNRIKRLSKYKIRTEWTSPAFLWLKNYTEKKHDDTEEVNVRKLKTDERLMRIAKVYIDDYESRIRNSSKE